jgi:hypothetical protein
MSIPLPIINYHRWQYTLGSRHPDPFLQPTTLQRKADKDASSTMNIHTRLRGSIAPLQTLDLIAKSKRVRQLGLRFIFPLCTALMLRRLSIR